MNYPVPALRGHSIKRTPSPCISSVVLTSLQPRLHAGAVARTRKTEQLQIRVTRAEKDEVRRAAKAANLDVSTWVLSRLLADKRAAFRSILESLPDLGTSVGEYAALSDFLHELPQDEFSLAVDVPPPPTMSEAARNYVAAMVEHAAFKKRVRPPPWTKNVRALAEPYFGTKLKRLRLLLMTTAPVAFRRRNIFVDASVGDRV